MGGLGHGPLQPAPQRGRGMEMPLRLPCPLLWFLFQGWVLLMNVQLGVLRMELQ